MRPAPAPRRMPAGWRKVGPCQYRSRGGLAVILTDGLELDDNWWRHLSLSRGDRIPSWEDLGQARDIFLSPHLPALQVLPPKAEYVDDHPFVLHLWQRIRERATPDFRRNGTI